MNDKVFPGEGLVVPITALGSALSFWVLSPGHYGGGGGNAKYALRISIRHKQLLS